jgi:hypothetical protein
MDEIRASKEEPAEDQQISHDERPKVMNEMSDKMSQDEPR